MTAFLLSVIFIFVLVIFILLLSFRSFVKKEMYTLNYQLKDLKTQLAKQRFEKKGAFVEEKDEIPDIVPEKLIEEPEPEKEPEVQKEPPIVNVEPEEVKKEEITVEKENNLINTQPEKQIIAEIREKEKVFVKPPVKKKKTDFEKFIGENLMNKIGILILVIAVGLGIKYAIGEGWINPVGRIAIGLVTGIILVSIAHKLRKNYTAFSSVLAGGGIAVFYSSIAFGFQMYELFTQTQAFLIMVIITGFAIVLSLTYNKRELAVLAILGGFASPIMVSTGEGNYIILFTYIMILDIGMLVLAYFKKWKIVNIVSFVSTIILFGIWMAKTFYDTDTLPYQGVFIFATLFYLVFFLMNIINNLKEGEKFTALDFIILIINSFLYFGVGMFLIDKIDKGYLGIFTISIAVLNFAFAFPLYKRSQIDRNLVFLLIGLVLTFVSLAAPVQLDGNYITMFWAVESVLLLWMSQKSGIQLMKISSFLIMLLMIVSLIMDWEHIYLNPHIDAQPLTIILNKGFITSIVSIVALVFSMNLLKKDDDIQFIKKLPSNVFSTIVTVFVIISLYVALFLEIGYQVDQYFEYYRLTEVALAFYTYLYIMGILLWTNAKQVKYVFEGITIIALLSMLVYALGIGFEYKRVINAYLYDNISNSFSIIHFLTALLALGLAYFSWDNIRKMAKNNTVLINIVLWANIIFAVVILSNELDYIVLLANKPSAENSYDIVKSVHRIGWPILWGVFAFMLMLIGMRKKMKMLRLISISLFFFTILKLFIVDVKDMSEGGRFAAFGFLGVLFIVVSFLYQKLRKLIFEDGGEDE
ncbi:MAG: hypothetical protein B6I20_04765 [Bacteroidetes bacterium 4572_117]|nr:MAG: hypothetical protein B6I20_04765 [Bacteroidetes bacterium 4572_117]